MIWGSKITAKKIDVSERAGGGTMSSVFFAAATMSTLNKYTTNSAEYEANAYAKGT